MQRVQLAPKSTNARDRTGWFHPRGILLTGHGGYVDVEFTERRGGFPPLIRIQMSRPEAEELGIGLAALSETGKEDSEG